MATTRTIGPLHFEDLDPKRFKDLVRQLAYEFKLWRRLEATGRSGSDDGFDARGYAIVAKAFPSASVEDSEPVEERATLNEGTDDRLWLIQCKRERAIGPKALLKDLDDTVRGPDEKLHGLVFTAACDFSKKARDDFARKCRETGLEEWHLWGKAELEDRLFRTKHLMSTCRSYQERDGRSDQVLPCWATRAQQRQRMNKGPTRDTAIALR